MKTIGITGQNGFVGTHLQNTISLLKDEFLFISFDRCFFDSPSKLEDWVRQCDVIVHLAALNRHADANELHDVNLGLVQKLVAALEKTGHRPHVIISSSTQEVQDNLYGKSKKAGRQL